MQAVFALPNTTAAPFTSNRFRQQTLPSNRRILSFGAPMGASPLFNSHFDDGLKSLYAQNRYDWDSSRGLLYRHLDSEAYRVLDAPDASDDFYLNLLDWNSANVMAVGLATEVHAYDISRSKIVKVCMAQRANGLFREIELPST